MRQFVKFAISTITFLGCLQGTLSAQAITFNPTFRTLNCHTTKIGRLGISDSDRYLKFSQFCIKIIL